MYHPEGSPGFGDRLKKTSALIGITLLGPSFVYFVIAHFIKGELPARGDRVLVSAADNPFLFYAMIALLGAASLKLTQFSIYFAIGYFRGRRRY